MTSRGTRSSTAYIYMRTSAQMDVDFVERAGIAPANSYIFEIRDVAAV